jgi:GNAT superfamily N-acetyltransferase
MFEQLAARLPDVPRWVETRGILLSGRCALVESPGPGPGDFVVRWEDFGLFCVAGKPALGSLPATLERHAGRTVLCTDEEAGRVAEALPGWTRSRALIHILPGSFAIGERPTSGIAFHMLSAESSRSLDHLSEPLREEIRTALGFTHVAAAFVGPLPVAFCYAGYETEKFWDVSIDTLEAYRGRGLARGCCEFLIGHMARHGKEPVWGALQRNAASRGLAASLGFTPVDALAVFEPVGIR